MCIIHFFAEYFFCFPICPNSDYGKCLLVRWGYPITINITAAKLYGWMVYKRCGLQCIKPILTPFSASWQDKRGKGRAMRMKFGRSGAETSEILVSREFSRFFFHFHFSFSISSRFNFTFTSRKRVKGFYFSLFTSRKKWKLSVFHSFFSRKKSEIRSGV